MNQAFEIPAVKLSPNWSAVRAYQPHGPMTLIEFESKKGERRRSRLDLHKRMFIDSVPVKIRPKLIRQIQQRVASATE